MELSQLTHPELEERYRTAELGPLPQGVWRGHHLGFLASPGARSRMVRLLDSALFVWPRFGIDFERRVWWFVHPRARTARFRMSPGRSRWRDTEVVRLEYDGSSLPYALRSMLYDEIKPLDDRRALGIGGVNAPRGHGEHFFFALERLGP